MKYQVQEYLLALSKSGAEPEFASVTCRYGEFAIYCLIGPEEKVLQVTFAPAKHDRLQTELQNLNANVYIRKMRQKDSHLSDMFAEYFSGRLTSFPIDADSPLIAAGTDFQKRVWNQIKVIPYAGRITYQDLAEQAGSINGARAAGTACGANPMALIIPCHRVVAVHGLGGFGGGITVKKSLLALERRTNAGVK
jgi:methylated-DNA-[protein]-cysteine S-methyltransferase